ncbi:MAG: glycoside hydrolase family 30 protein [Chthoniobacteraceae bacterium]|nr:glycoside hydrolase family 30 protein [Chthoniobacteraceae bacterium]
MTAPAIRVFLTARDTSDRLAEKAPLSIVPGKESGGVAVYADPAARFQEIEGFGGAFTEAAATTLQKMSPASQERILAAYFGREQGHGYSLCRTHINSCDFALGNYAYTETPGDTGLCDFSLERDRQALLPMIQRALKTAGGEPFKLFASPWSPPAWMKTTGQMNRGGKLKPEYRQAWANYYVRYIQEYAKAGVAIWGLTVQNEPEAAQRWDSCIYSAREESDFVRDYLGPTLENAGLGHVKIIIWDHNRDQLVRRAAAAYGDPAASRYIWGTGYHWYCDDKFDNLQLHHDAWPEKKLLFTEGCQEGGPHLGSWLTGERYARSMIQDFNRWAVGWTDWNLLLDEQGGPNHVGNFCSAPIVADTRTDEVLFQSSYYYIGHFARFVRPGARRILCSTTRDALEATGFVNPDGTVVVVLMNRTETPFAVSLETPAGVAEVTAPRRSIATFVVLPTA